MKTVIISESPLDPAAYEHFEVEDPLALLASRWSRFPETARIYNGQVSQDRDVTPLGVPGPAHEAAVAALRDAEGPLYVLVMPTGQFAVPIIIVAAAIAASAAMAFLIKPKVPSASSHQDSPSSNNELSDRQNRPRLNGRIPDIFGQVRSIPDLLSPPLRFFDNHHEVELSFMCVGRGSYLIEDVRDGATRVEQIAGQEASVEVYGPFTRPGGTPQLRIGNAIGEPLAWAKRFDPVNGQTMEPSNAEFQAAVHSVEVNPAGIITMTGDPHDFRFFFAPGDSITIGRMTGDRLWTATDTSDLSEVAPSIDGTYTVATVTADTIVTVERILPDNWIGAHTDNAVIFTNAKSRWIGPFTLDVADATEVWLNFIAPSGLYWQKNDGSQAAIDVEMQVEITPVNAAGAPTGPPQLFSGPDLTVHGAADVRSQRALTARIPFVGPCSVRARRVSEFRLANYPGTVVQEVRWRDAYAMRPAPQPDFGDVTTVYARTYVTGNASLPKERKLNMLATRKVQHWDGATLSTDLFPTRRADDILVALALDPRIGRRTLAELDMPGIYSTVAQVEAYFGTAKVVEFSATLDKSDMSFEETAAAVAAAIFCSAYRTGPEIQLFFERETPDSVLLFNGRNTLPGTEARTTSFGPVTGVDGVELTFVDPEQDDAVGTIYMPANRTAKNPKKVETVGVRSRLQAYFHACREYNKILYQNTGIEFEATEEASLLIPGQRFLKTVGIRPGAQAGQVTGQSGLVLTLDKAATLGAGKTYHAFLQLADGTVQSIPVTPGTMPNEVVLAQVPRVALALDGAAPTAYEIVADDDTKQRAFIVSEKEPQGRFTVIVRGFNYDARYYSNDGDLLDGTVNARGFVV